MLRHDESRAGSSSYEASDESSENELLDRSLSFWHGWLAVDDDDDDNDFVPCPLDLHTASSIGHYECVRDIITRKEVDINRCNKGGWTPLMYACYIGHENILNVLLKAKADVNIRNHKGQTALMLAASCGNNQVVHYLSQNGAELEGQDYRGWTVLFHATYAGHHNIVKFLLERNANINARDPNTGMTPFLEAAAGGHEIIVQLFLQHAVSLNAKTYSGDTAQSLALMNGHMNIVNLINQHTALKDKDLNSDETSSYLSGHRPLHQHPIIGRPIRNKMARGGPPDIRDGPDAFARLIERSKSSEHVNYPNSYVPEGYITFTQGNEDREDTHLRYRDVTSPINPQDHNLDSSGSKDSYDAEDESTVFSRTGALTIRSSSGSSGGLAAALGLSPNNSGDNDDILAPSLVGILPRESQDLSQEVCSALSTNLHSSQLPDNKQMVADNSRENVHAMARLGINSPNDYEAKYFPDRGYSSDPCRSTWDSSVCDFQIGPNEVFSMFPENRYKSFVGKNKFQLPLPDNQKDYNPLGTNPSSLQDPEIHPGQSLLQLPFPSRNPLTDPYTRTSNFSLPTSEKNQTTTNGKSGGSKDGSILGLKPPTSQNERTFLSERSEVDLEQFNLGYLTTSTAFSTSAENKMPRSYFDLEPHGSAFDGFIQGPTSTTSSNSLFSTDLPVSVEDQHPSSTCETSSSPALLTNAPMIDIGNGIVSGNEMHGNSNKPETLVELLLQLGLLKYQTIFEEQDVDLQVFLSLTDNDLKEIGIKLFGPRRKMTSAIARWHSDVRSPSDGLERAYADRLEAEMQEMAIQLHQANSQVKTLDAQILQEQKLRSVTEGCFMEERALRQREKRQMEDLCIRCEQTQKVFERLGHFHADFRERLVSSLSKTGDPLTTEILKNTDQLIKKVELCSNELQQTLDFVFKTIESLLRQENSPPSYLSPTFS